MLIKEQIEKFFSNDKLTITKDGSTTYIHHSSFGEAICVINSTNHAYGNKDYLKSISRLHSVERKLVSEVFKNYLEKITGTTLVKFVPLSNPSYKYVLTEELPYP